MEANKMVVRKPTEFDEFNSHLIALRTSLYIFEENFADLDKLITLLESDPRTDPLVSPDYREVLIPAFPEINRRLHNFVSAAISLFEHINVLYERFYAKHQLFQEYEQMRHDLTNSQLWNFVNQLRNYCLHIKSPDLTLTWSRNFEKQDSSRAIEFVIESSTFDWNDESREYIEQLGGNAKLLEVATTYKDMVLRFHESFLAEGELYDTRLKEQLRTEDKNRALKNLETQINDCVKNKVQTLNDISIYKPFLPARELIIIDEITEPSKRCAVAIRMLEKWIPLSESSKKKMAYLYTHGRLVSN